MNKKQITTQYTQKMTRMRSLLLLPALAITLFSCGGNDGDMITQLKEDRDSLKVVKTEVAEMLADLEKQISELDTTVDKRIPVISTMGLNHGRFEHFFQVQGVVETDQNAQVYPEAQGRITKISVKEGQRVSKGQLLMTIDSRVLRNNIDEVKARYELAETIFRKQENLWGQKIGSEIQYLEAKNNKDALKNNLEALNAQLDMYTVNAPFAGTVDEIYPKEGEMASPMGPAVRMLNLDKVYIKADVSESYLGKIKVGDSVKVNFPSLEQTFWTQISRIGDFINPNNRTFKISLDLSNTSNALKPNLLGEIDVKDFSADSTLAVPSNLILQTPNGEEFVMVTDKMEDGKLTVRQQTITTGLSFKGSAHVLSGLTGAEMVVTKGARSVKPGEEVQVQNESK